MSMRNCKIISNLVLVLGVFLVVLVWFGWGCFVFNNVIFISFGIRMEEKSLQHASQPLLTRQRLNPYCLGAFSHLQPACGYLPCMQGDTHSVIWCTQERGANPFPASGLSCTHVPRQHCPPLLPMCMAGNSLPSGTNPLCPRLHSTGFYPPGKDIPDGKFLPWSSWLAAVSLSINTIQQELFSVEITVSKIVMWTKLCCPQNLGTNMKVQAGIRDN